VAAAYSDCRPCVIESEAHVRTMADALQRITRLGVGLIFKASYDKPTAPA